MATEFGRGEINLNNTVG